ncbi:adenosylhomocysteinase [Candidatus Kaiserbacteria bacterium RIFCSPLOWO2_12_FULL_53_8]|uniref:Adenosylhomocysteinase n=2 Tax=Candidatus Kaiseribacteriota TaxID=1752734 RepID=A0A1F6CXP4_9BACT|nr:MAG: adenosylhomocysteinase [Candidatus Kaiserbacteria bacterium RIFCSPHIGHO2_01_FULL_53_29]OGG92207.1 MAG: adenosylhomocysteinase [Candidatus Kaiserbacteria bacterium RIFCSPLOWO2_12_FULL_53_8]
MEYDIKDISLGAEGKRLIEWAARDMPVLSQIRERFAREQPFKGKKIGACLHVTVETANLVIALKAGGAEVVLCASNPLSSQDEAAAGLVGEYGIPVFAISGEDRDTFFKHITAVVAIKPDITMDDGADLVTTIHKDHTGLLQTVLGGTEETTTGVIRLRAMARDGALKMPLVAVNDAKTKNLFDNRYGTGQSTLEAIIRATDMLVAGRTFVIAGYGWCGKGLAMRARGMGANIIVCEVDAIKALEAAMDGFRVLPMAEACEQGDLFCTVTGDINVIRGEHFKKMKDGAFVCNAGHFDVEVSITDLEKLGGKPVRVRDNVDQYTVGGKKIYLLAEGRLVNLAAAEGHPASVMDMSFSTQALACEWLAKQPKRLAPAVYDVPEDIENTVAKLKLASMGIEIDELTAEQKKYLSSWQEGT